MANTFVSQENNPFFEKQVEKARPGAKILNSLQGFIIFIFILIFVYLFVATPNQVNGNSMWPTFHNKEVLLTYRLVGVIGNMAIGKTLDITYHHGDVIILQKPGYDEFIKRVIGLPGETIKVQGGHVYRNGELLNEPYLGSFVNTNAGDLFTEGKELTVPEGDVVVMGDNRPGSFDSRFQAIGFIKMEWIKGRVLVRIFPVNEIGFVQHADYVYKAEERDANGPPADE